MILGENTPKINLYAQNNIFSFCFNARKNGFVMILNLYILGKIITQNTQIS